MSEEIDTQPARGIFGIPCGQDSQKRSAVGSFSMATEVAFKAIEEAKKALIKSWPTGSGNSLNALWYVMHGESHFAIRFVCKYELNGKKHVFDTTREKRDFRTVNELLLSVMEDFSKHFALHFAPPLLDAAASAFPR